jgi:hypothetical protein
MRCYLYYAGSAFEKPEPYRSLGEAKDAFLRTARHLDRFGQRCEATLHLRDERIHDEPKCAEYPDWTLSLTERGNLKCERT